MLYERTKHQIDSDTGTVEVICIRPSPYGGFDFYVNLEPKFGPSKIATVTFSNKEGLFNSWRGFLYGVSLAIQALQWED